MKLEGQEMNVNAYENITTNEQRKLLNEHTVHMHKNKLILQAGVVLTKRQEKQVRSQP
jgi:hypothetical protein